MTLLEDRVPGFLLNSRVAYLDQSVREEPVHLPDDGRQPAPVILLLLSCLNRLSPLVNYLTTFDINKKESWFNFIVYWETINYLFYRTNTLDAYRTRMCGKGYGDPVNIKIKKWSNNRSTLVTTAAGIKHWMVNRQGLGGRLKTLVRRRGLLKNCIRARNLK